MKEKENEEGLPSVDERRRLASIYGVDVADMQELALLPCGASLRRVGHDNIVAAMFGLSPRAPERYPLRDGDAGLFCPDMCIDVHGSCPLLKEYLGIKSAVDLERFAKRLVDEFKTGDGDGDLADVRDADNAVPCGASANVRIRFLAIKGSRQLYFIVPPMAKIVDERDDGGSSGRNDGDAGEGV